MWLQPDQEMAQLRTPGELRMAHLPYQGVCKTRGLQASICAARGLFYLLHGAWPAEA